MAKVERRDQIELWVAGALWAVGLLLLFIAGLMARSEAAATRAYVTTVYAGSFVLVAALGVTAVLILLHFQRIQAGREATVGILRQLLSGQTQNEAVLTGINENLLLSDAIKSVAFRDKDRTALQDAIRQDIRREKWESAELLTDEFEKRFGHQGAEELRQEMRDGQNATIQDKIDGAIEHVKSLWMIHHYEQAEQEVQALVKLYPDNATVQELIGETEKRRQEHKESLLARWDEALKANDVDQGVELLKLLDSHLTPTEGAALKESARGIFKAKLHQMGVQFSLLVAQKKWSQSLTLGRSIIEEFPNSRMAEEVRSKLDIMAQRAEEE